MSILYFKNFELFGVFWIVAIGRPQNVAVSRFIRMRRAWKNVFFSTQCVIIAKNIIEQD
jgi:hypothetical protein